MNFNMNTGGKMNMFKNRFKNKDDDQKSLLSGTWELEIPVAEFLNAPPPSSSDSSDTKDDKKTISNPNSVSNRQSPMIQISEDLNIISIPLSTDIANPHIYKKYLLSISISNNNTMLEIINNDKIKLIYDHNNDVLDNSFILEGTINIDTLTIRWGDGSSWTKMKMDDDDDDSDQLQIENKQQDNNKADNCNININELRSQLELSREKEQMAKSQTQATMGQFADLSQQFAKLTKEHEIIQKK
eukprot:131218_1